MEIDSRFRVVLNYVTSQGTPKAKNIVASEFFDADDFEESEWACDLPWRFLTLNDYLPHDERPYLECRLTITDTRSTKQSVVYVRNLNGILVTLSWGVGDVAAGQFELILDVPRDKAGGVHEIARMSVDETNVKLTLHGIVDGDKYEFYH